MSAQRHLKITSCILSLVAKLFLLLLSPNYCTALSIPQSRTAVVVGGGPAGLSAAVVLAQGFGSNGHPWFDQVIVLDAEPSGKSSFDPTRAYFYNLNRRGQRLVTDQLGLDLSSVGVGIQTFARRTVPADPQEVFDGSAPAFARELSPEVKRRMGTLYWMPRHRLVELLRGRLFEEDVMERIKFCAGTRCEYVEPNEDGRVRVVVRKEEGEEQGTSSSYMADLCVGADGLSSQVRNSLADGRFKEWSNAGNGSGFHLKQYTSPSSGLRIKGMKLPPDFAIPVGGEGYVVGGDAPKTVTMEPEYTYAIKSTTTGPTDRLELSFLPQKEPLDYRITNICTMPNHYLWKIQDGPTMKAFFAKAFPRFDWDRLLPHDEWDAFAKTTGSRFPPCQYSPRMHVSSPRRDAGVVLVGDTLHSFPPDLGQGVNAALTDVRVLGECLEEALSSNRTISTALAAYACRNGPETRALVALARCGAPFQYNQPSRAMRFRKRLWTANVALRVLLNKLTMGLSPKPAVIQMMDAGLSFRQIMRRAQALTASLWLVLGVLVWRVVLGLVKVTSAGSGVLL